MGADPAFGEGVRDRGAYGCLEDPESFGSEDLVQGVDDLATPVSDERPRVGELVGMVEEEVAGCLGGPGAGRVRGAAGEVHLAGRDIDEEQQVVAA